MHKWWWLSKTRAGRKSVKPGVDFRWEGLRSGLQDRQDWHRMDKDRVQKMPDRSEPRLLSQAVKLWATPKGQTSVSSTDLGIGLDAINKGSLHPSSPLVPKFYHHQKCKGKKDNSQTTGDATNLECRLESGAGVEGLGHGSFESKGSLDQKDRT